MTNRQPPPVVERETATLSETKADRHREYTRRPNESFMLSSNNLTTKGEIALSMVRRNQRASSEVKKLERIAKERSMRVKQFDDVSEQELADVLALRRRLIVRAGQGITPLTHSVSEILEKSTVDIDSDERIPIRKGALYDNRTESAIELEHRFGTDKENVVSGWQLSADSGDKIPRGQCVYLVYGAGLFKIGSTHQLNIRISQLRTDSPAPLHISRVIVCFEGKSAARDVEGCLHHAFSEKKVHGEWFALNDDDLAYIDISCAEWLVKYPDPIEEDAA